MQAMVQKLTKRKKIKIERMKLDQLSLQVKV